MAHQSYSSTANRVTKANAVLGDLAGAVLKLYTAPMPGDGDTTPSGTLLGSGTLLNPAGTQAAGVVTVTAINVPITAGGTVAVAHLLKADGVTKIDTFNVGATGGGFCLELDRVAVVAGDTVQLQTFTWTEPGAGQ